MGEKLLKYYSIVEESGGVQAKVRLAMKTGVSSKKAVELPDSAENLEKFYRAAVELVGKEFPKP